MVAALHLSLPALPKLGPELLLLADEAPMSIDRLLHDPSKRRCSFHSAFDPVEEMDMQDVDEAAALAQGGFSGEAAERTPMDSTTSGDGGSDDFVLARGHVTPNNLLPGWNDAAKGPGGPLKAPAVGAFRRSGELSTFEERLHEASLCCALPFSRAARMAP